VARSGPRAQARRFFGLETGGVCLEKCLDAKFRGDFERLARKRDCSVAFFSINCHQTLRGGRHGP
jgi:hypothetical protein